MAVLVFLVFTPMNHHVHSLRWMFPAERPLVELSLGSPSGVPHLCDCASAFLICPQVPSLYLPTKGRHLLLHHNPLIRTPKTWVIFVFNPFPLGAWALLLNLSYWSGIWSANIRNTCNHEGATHRAQALALPGRIRSFRAFSHYNAAPQEARRELLK